MYSVFLNTFWYHSTSTIILYLKVIITILQLRRLRLRVAGCCFHSRLAVRTQGFWLWPRLLSLLNSQSRSPGRRLKIDTRNP